MKHLTDEEKKMAEARHLLPEPGAEVVGDCLNRIDRLRGRLRAHVYDRKTVDEWIDKFRKLSGLDKLRILSAIGFLDSPDHNEPPHALLGELVAAFNKMESHAARGNVFCSLSPEIAGVLTVNAKKYWQLARDAGEM